MSRSLVFDETSLMGGQPGRSVPYDSQNLAWFELVEPSHSLSDVSFLERTF